MAEVPGGMGMALGTAKMNSRAPKARSPSEFARSPMVVSWLESIDRTMSDSRDGFFFLSKPPSKSGISSCCTFSPKPVTPPGGNGDYTGNR